MNRFAERLRSSLRGAWGEHGAWVVGLVSVSCGLIMARSLDPAALVLLPAVASATAAKGLVTSARRSGHGWIAAAIFGLASAACAAPAALKRPWAIALLAALAVPFAILYVLFADSARWTRSLAVELSGTFLLASASGLPIAVARQGADLEALSAWSFFGCAFLPGVLRARIPKSPGLSLRVACTAAAAISLALLTACAVTGREAWWGLAAAPPIAKEAYRAWALPDWSTRRLGLNLTLKAAYVGLVVSLAWQPGPL